jgi:Ca2+-binding RTX toxin-like protein
MTVRSVSLHLRGGLRLISHAFAANQPSLPQTEVKRWLARTFVAVLALLGAVVLGVASTWIFGNSPYVQYLKLIHDDIPRLVIPVRLVQGVPVKFQARIIYKGGAGNDTFVFRASLGQDTITDFTAGHDVLEFRDGIFANAAAALAAATVSGNDTLIAIDATNSVLLQNVALANLHASDFHVV